MSRTTGDTVARMATPPTDATLPRKAGRPPRISRAMIAEAAHELGLEGLTLKAVADHLGVSVAALYHHVSGKDDLMRIAAAESTRAIPLPVDHGQGWAQWLLDWAHYNREVFSAQPGLLGQYLEGAIPPESVMHNLEAILAVLVREGFSVDDANAAYELVSTCALGFVVASMWERSISRGEKDLAGRYRRALETTPRRQLTLVRQLYRDGGRRMTFDERIEIVLQGLSARSGLALKSLEHHGSATQPKSARRSR